MKASWSPFDSAFFNRDLSDDDDDEDEVVDLDRAQVEPVHNLSDTESEVEWLGPPELPVTPPDLYQPAPPGVQEHKIPLLVQGTPDLAELQPRVPSFLPR